jgi:transcriptional regulator with XRE-family HTH domain
MKDFSMRIKNLREGKDMTPSQLASVFGKSEGAVRAWETGRTKPDADTLIEISKYFGVTTDYLLGLSDGKSVESDIIHKETGLSEKAIELLKHYVEADEQNSRTLTVNTLLENKAVLSKIAEYLYYELEKDEKAELMDDDYDETGDKYRVIPYTVIYKYLSNFGEWGDDVDKLPIDNDIAIEAITPKKYKKITLLELNDELEKLLEQENKINHFE